MRQVAVLRVRPLHDSESLRLPCTAYLPAASLTSFLYLTALLVNGLNSARFPDVVCMNFLTNRCHYPGILGVKLRSKFPELFSLANPRRGRNNPYQTISIYLFHCQKNMWNFCTAN